MLVLYKQSLYMLVTGVTRAHYARPEYQGILARFGPPFSEIWTTPFGYFSEIWTTC